MASFNLPERVKNSFFRLLCKAGLGVCTAEARLPGGGQAQSPRRKEFLINQYSELGVLRASVVNTL